MDEWMKFPYILSGYRGGIKNYKDAFLTLFSIHNETVNIWTMMCLFFLASTLFAYTTWFIPTISSIVPFALFFLASAIHLPFSVGYHLFLPISNEIKIKWRNLDITFIFVCGTLFAMAFGYSVMNNFQLLLLGCVCTLISLVGIYTIRSSEKYDRVRVCQLIGLIVICYLFPLYYHAITKSDIFSFYLALGTTIVLGASALIYKDCIPERFAPGKYDIIGNSHNLMHLGLIIAYVIEYCFLLHLTSE